MVPAIAGALVLALVLSTVGGRASLASETVRALDRGSPPPPAGHAVDGAGDGATDAAAASAPVMRLLMLGDSVGASLGLGLERSANASNGELVTWNKATLGCGMLRQGEVDIGSEPFVQDAVCDDWESRWGLPMTQFQPNVVVLLTGAWDLLDRKINGQYYSPGSVAFDRYFLAELDLATQLLARQGAKVVVLTTPFLSRPELVGQTGRNWPEYEPWRVDRINGLYRDFATRYPERYALIDLNEYVSPGGKYAEYIGDVRVRDDGVHFAPGGADLVSAWLLPQLREVLAGNSTTDVPPEAYDSRKLRAV